MIIPIGHQERSVRRLPWVTLSLIGLCVLVFLFTDTKAAEPTSGNSEALEVAADYWRQRAYLSAHPAVREEVAYDVMPNQRRQYLETLPDLSPYGPDADGGLVAQQAELDRLTDLALGLVQTQEQNAFTRWGVVPHALSATAFVTYAFIHAGWLHLLGNLFMLWLAGPPIEDRWGRGAFAAFYLMAGVFAAVFFLGFAGDTSAPLVGASGAIAGVLGAFVVRLWSTQIRFAYFFMVGLRPLWGTFEAPAWAMLSLWFANELFQAVLWDSMGGTSGVAYWCHVGGFVFGVGAAHGMRVLEIEERYVNPKVDAQLTHFSANPVLEEALSARERGDVAGAAAMLEEEWRKQPDDEIALAFWDAAVACGRTEAAAPAMLSSVRSALRRGEQELALRHWSELSDRAPEALLDAATLLRFVPMLLAENQRERASLALRQAVHPGNTPLTPGQALRVFDLARDLDPPSAVRAARVALASPDLHEAKRAKLLAQVAELEAAGAEAPPTPPPLAPEEPEPAWDESGAIDMARFARAKLVEARPRALEAEGIRVVLEGDREARVAYAKIQAVSVAIVANLGPKPILLIDLLANWNTPEAEVLQGIRLRSDRFDARKLVEGETDPQRAFRALVGKLLEATRGEPLPSVEAALGDPFARYAELAEYERTVLAVEG